MSRGAKIGIAAAVLLALPVLAVLFMFVWMAPPDDLDLSREKPTANGLYTVAVAPETEPVDRNTLHAWVATVKAADGAPVGDRPRHVRPVQCRCRRCEADHDRIDEASRDGRTRS